MKRCPKCDETYSDDLHFCLVDGSPLLPSHDPEKTVVKRKPYDRERVQDSDRDLRQHPARKVFRSPSLYIVLVVVLIITLTIGVILYAKRGRELNEAQGQVEQLQMEVISLKRETSELEAKVASMRPSNITGVRFVRVAGGWVHDDIYFINNSGKDLEDVDVSITLSDLKGVEKNERNLFGLWRNGEERYIRVVSGTHQKGSMRGFCNQGRINVSWVF